MLNIFLLNCGFCQIIEYRFSQFVTDFSSARCNGYSWTSTQEYITDSSFIFRHIFCQCDTCACCGIVFKTDSSGNWYIIESGEEFLFFDNTTQSLKSVSSKQCNKSILAREEQIIENVTLYGFVRETAGVITTRITYWFNNKYGIVAQQSNVLYVRDDFIEQVLCK